ncbi:assimilatory sulfite reductase (NADPH) flavoprotein subunit [Maribellus maritimus]|uniref:assimilatory sulfite reductase (NADPH) flavoprotein subunit n=1 Tax=Maribellus maritimus TaxID=2870838 RepID=UPI001EEC48A7|nr:assimilatory sulfite reductase (NADPH) flavoprotein subunit [Maribellus maritimus]MCG6186862.1 assimilatory sulfite reductase (NADPH) flavoprotein subunit [Maribellus maritimus]
MSLKSNPLSEKQKIALNELVKDVTVEQIIWLNGFLDGRLAGLNGNGSPVEVTSVVTEAVKETTTVANLTILFGTETGNAEEVAQKLAEKASFKNVAVNVVDMYDYDPKKLKDEENVAIIVSTHGEGEPPDMAEEFHKFVTGKRLPKLENLSFSVLALGDKTYRNFCQTGEEIYNAIKKSGGFPATPLAKCDVDYEATAEVWMNNLLINLAPSETTTKVETAVEETTVITSPPATKVPVSEFSKKNPFSAMVLDKVRITGNGSDKEVYHLELSLEESGLTYEPGDSVGVFTKNPPELVDDIIQKCGFDPEKNIAFGEEEVSLLNALTYHYEITVMTFDSLQKYYGRTKNPELKIILEDDKKLDEYLYGCDLLDLLDDFPFDWNVNKLIEILRPLPPRLYSISSSMESVGEEVHITVSVVNFERKKRQRFGACSSNLADFIDQDDKIPIYIEKNPGFRLPANGARIIMVGAGTGIAPYRAFMQQRESLGMKGNTWLFFGDRRFQSDFLYQTEWQKLLEKKLLERMDVAFSRDQEEKIYVQHKLKENRKEIFNWMDNGAHFYLCGDRKNMANDVTKTFLEIIRTEGGVSEEQAEKYLKQLKKEKRFQTDVY